MLGKQHNLIVFNKDRLPLRLTSALEVLLRVSMTLLDSIEKSTLASPDSKGKTGKGKDDRRSLPYMSPDSKHGTESGRESKPLEGDSAPGGSGL